MAINNKRRKSFFTEQRESNLNPNFINTMDFLFLRNNVKRIIRDAAEGLIIQEDLVYFSSENVLNACLQESYEQWLANRTLKMALTYYRNVALPNKWIPPEIGLDTEYVTSGNELIKATERESIWGAANYIFTGIANQTIDLGSALMQFTRFQKQSIRNL